MKGITYDFEPFMKSLTYCPECGRILGYIKSNLIKPGRKNSIRRVYTRCTNSFCDLSFVHEIIINELEK